MYFHLEIATTKGMVTSVAEPAMKLVEGGFYLDVGSLPLNHLHYKCNIN